MADALKWKSVRVSLGDVKDEAEIRDFHRTSRKIRSDLLKSISRTGRFIPTNEIKCSVNSDMGPLRTSEQLECVKIEKEK